VSASPIETGGPRAAIGHPDDLEVRSDVLGVVKLREHLEPARSADLVVPNAEPIGVGDRSLGAGREHHERGSEPLPTGRRLAVGLFHDDQRLADGRLETGLFANLASGGRGWRLAGFDRATGDEPAIGPLVFDKRDPTGGIANAGPGGQTRPLDGPGGQFFEPRRRQRERLLLSGNRRIDPIGVGPSYRTYVLGATADRRRRYPRRTVTARRSRARGSGRPAP